MQSNDKAKFYTALESVCEMYGQKKPSPTLVAMYFTALQHITVDDFKAAVNLHVRDTDQGQFFPKPADILRNIQGNKSTQAEQAWTKVDKAIRCVGPHESVVFDDRLIHAVIDDMGGWITLCDCSLDEYPFKHNEFVKRYTGFVNRAPDRIPPKLIGSNEAYNVREGLEHHVAPPRLIGDPSRAMMVLKTESGAGRVGIVSMGDVVKKIGNLEAKPC